MASKTKKSEPKVAQGCPVHVVVGKDRRRTADAVSETIDALLGDADPQVAVNSYEGPQAELADVLDDLRTLPFLSPIRIVVVKEADPFITKYREHLESYLNAPCSTGVLVMMVESFPSNTRLAKLAAKIGNVIRFEAVKPRELARYLTNYAKDKYNLTLDRAAATVLTDLGGEDVGMLMGEIDKIATYLADPDKPAQRITQDDVEALVCHNRQYNAFNVIDAMTSGATADALERLDEMMRQDRNAQYTAVGAFAWHVRRLYNARLMMDQGMNGQAITKQLRIWPKPDAFIAQVRRLSIAEIAELLRSLMRIDLASKTGAGTVQAGLEKLIIEFTQQAQARPAG